MKAGGIFFILFISVFYLVGFGLLGYGIRSAVRSNAAADWPTAPGSIVNLALDSSTDSDGDTTYEVKVNYIYTIASKVYKGSTLALGYTSSSGKEAHEKIHQKLKNSQSVQVRYDPADPDSSVLSFGMHRSIQLTFAFALTWLAFVIGFTVLWWLGSRNDDVLMKNLLVQ